MSNQRYITLQYDQLTQLLTRDGWRKQEDVWLVQRTQDKGHRLEWWNLGSYTPIVLYVQADERGRDRWANVFIPASRGRVETFLRRAQAWWLNRKSALAQPSGLAAVHFDTNRDRE